MPSACELLGLKLSCQQQLQPIIKEITMKKSLSALVVLSALGATPVMAQDLDITITNLTNGIHFTPFLAAAHGSTTHLFMEGSAASSHLQAMAEGGDISGLSSDVQALSGDVVENPASGFLAPGTSVSFDMMTTTGNTHLSLTAMLLPTNDGFVGADAIEIPTTAGTYTYCLNAYDAGTEANNEVVNGGGTPGTLGIPADPGAANGSGGTGVTTTESNSMVHIHPGVLGDSDPTGGVSDLDSRVHRWLNPVAKLVITVN